MQGSDQRNGLCFCIDHTPKSVWDRQGLLTLVSRVTHLQQLILLNFDTNKLRSIVLDPITNTLAIDEWAHRTNLLHHIPFNAPMQTMFNPLPESNMPPAETWIAYCVANPAGQTYIGCALNGAAREEDHNDPQHRRCPIIMKFLPQGWHIYVWVGPLDCRKVALSFEARWKSKGKYANVRKICNHVASAYACLSEMQLSSADVHYDASF